MILKNNHLGINDVREIQRFEGFFSHAYKDVGGVWTIGYGSVMVGGVSVRSGDVIDASHASELLIEELVGVEKAVNVVGPLHTCEFGALCSLVYNIGIGAFERSKLRRILMKRDVYSTLLDSDSVLRHGHHHLTVAAADEFLRWRYVGKKVIPGLVNRRAVERRWFLWG